MENAHPSTSLLSAANGDCLLCNNDWKSMLCLFWMVVPTWLCNVFYLLYLLEENQHVVSFALPLYETSKLIIRVKMYRMFCSQRNEKGLCSYLFMQLCHIEKDLPGYETSRYICDMKIKKLIIWHYQIFYTCKQNFTAILCIWWSWF